MFTHWIRQGDFCLPNTIQLKPDTSNHSVYFKQKKWALLPKHKSDINFNQEMVKYFEASNLFQSPSILAKLRNPPLSFISLKPFPKKNNENELKHL